MNGKFYGVGVGPGDPELLTIRAARVIKEGDVLAIPVSYAGLESPVYEEADTEGMAECLCKCTAYQIARKAVPETEHKAKLYLPMPMVKDEARLREIHNRDAQALAELLEHGKNTVFLTLGDPTVYSTCLYVHRRLKDKGYATELIPGVPSFCAAAARLDTGLAEKKEELHVIPASYGVEEALALKGTKVLMKAGRKMPEVIRAAAESGQEIVMVENCGMPGERVCRRAEEIPQEAGYYSLLIVKEKED